MSLDGSIYMVRLLEIDLAFDQGMDNLDPIIDGVLLLYDSTRSEKLTEASVLAGTYIPEVAFRSYPRILHSLRLTLTLGLL